MAPKQRLIFATKSDLITGIANLELKRPLRYVVNSIYDDTDNIVQFNSIYDYSDLGYHKTGKHLDGGLLIMDQSKELQIEGVPQSGGGIKYFLGEDRNPFAIGFWPGGIFNEHFLIRGTLRTRFKENELSNDLYNTFSREVTRGFKKVDGCYIGPEALSLAKEGKVILIANHYEEPKEYNVQVD